MCTKKFYLVGLCSVTTLCVLCLGISSLVVISDILERPVVPTALYGLLPSPPPNCPKPTTPTPSASGPPRVYRTIMTGKDICAAKLAFQMETKRPYIHLALTPDGTKILADFTSKNVGKFLAIAVNRKVILSPIIRSPITQGTVSIEGRFTLEEAQTLLRQIQKCADVLEFVDTDDTELLEGEIILTTGP